MLFSRSRQLEITNRYFLYSQAACFMYIDFSISSKENKSINSTEGHRIFLAIRVRLFILWTIIISPHYWRTIRNKGFSKILLKLVKKMHAPAALDTFICDNSRGINQGHSEDVLVLAIAFLPCFRGSGWLFKSGPFYEAKLILW